MLRGRMQLSGQTASTGSRRRSEDIFSCKNESFAQVSRDADSVYYFLVPGAMLHWQVVQSSIIYVPLHDLQLDANPHLSDTCQPGRDVYPANHDKPAPKVVLMYDTPPQLRTAHAPTTRRRTNRPQPTPHRTDREQEIVPNKVL
jgi:hypothetical protein